MRAALDRVDIVTERVNVLGVAVGALECDLDHDIVFFLLKSERRLGQGCFVTIEMLDKFYDSAIKPEGFFLLVFFA